MIDAVLLHADTAMAQVSFIRPIRAPYRAAGRMRAAPLGYSIGSAVIMPGTVGTDCALCGPAASWSHFDDACQIRSQPSWIHQARPLICGASSTAGRPQQGTRPSRFGSSRPPQPYLYGDVSPQSSFLTVRCSRKLTFRPGTSMSRPHRKAAASATSGLPVLK